mgnify:CR=1 FL=1
MAADYLPFTVKGQYPHDVDARFDKNEAQPGNGVQVQVKTEGPARVSLAAVDRSVFILGENRVNLQQVFAELERLYMQPQVELHSFSIYDKIRTFGARDMLRDAGFVVITNKIVPDGQDHQAPRRTPNILERFLGRLRGEMDMEDLAFSAPAAIVAARYVKPGKACEP